MKSAQPPLIGAARHTQELLDKEMTTRGTRQVLVRGEGPTVVLVPTFGELGFVYAPLADSLSTGWQVVLYIPAVSTHQLFGPVERAEELVQVLDELGVDAAHLVGWSDAGAVVSAFAHRWPDRVRSRVYLGTPAAYVMPRGLRLLSALYARSALYRVTPDMVAAVLVALLMGGRAMPTRALLPQIRDLGAVARYLKFSILPCLRYPNAVPAGCPTLVAGGDTDRFVKLDHMVRLAQMTGTQFAYIVGGDHFLPWTARDEVTPVVTAFLAANRGT